MRLFDTESIQYSDIIPIRISANEDLKNKIQRISIGQHIPYYSNPTKKSKLDKLFRKAHAEALMNSEKSAKSYFEILYNITSNKIDSCQTRNAIFLKYLRDFNRGIYSSLHVFKHVIPVVLCKVSQYIDIDVFESSSGEYERLSLLGLPLKSESLPACISISDSNPQEKENKNDMISFGVYFLTLKKFLHEKAPDVAKAMENGSVDFIFTQSLPFSLLPILQFPTEFANKCENIVPLLLLAQDNVSLVPDVSKSNYTLENFKHITDSCFGNFLAFDMWNALNFIYNKFPSSKVLYINQRYYDNGQYDKGYLLCKSPQRWITDPVDGDFVKGAEDLRSYMSKNEKIIKLFCNKTRSQIFAEEKAEETNKNRCLIF